MINKFHVGDCLKILRTFPDKIINTCVTSPPYWGLRDYGTARWKDGSPDCDHFRQISSVSIKSSTLNGGKKTTGHQEEGWKNGICGKCGAIRIDNQLGLEETPEKYVENMVEVFREIKRVLRDDGTLWLNLGDSYASGGRGGGTEKQQTNKGSHLPPKKAPPGLKDKDLVGIPWRVAFALQSDGWYLRQDIIWHKPNPMPESVTDRCTKAHEYIFLLAKNQKYYYNTDAIREPLAENSKGRYGYGFNSLDMKSNGERENSGEVVEVPQDRNKRSVWTVTTKPYSEAHFATFPEDLIDPCIKAGCSPGGVVLDPFMGSGTVAKVARKNSVQWIGIELNLKYIELANKRNAQKELFEVC